MFKGHVYLFVRLWAGTIKPLTGAVTTLVSSVFVCPPEILFLENIYLLKNDVERKLRFYPSGMMAIAIGSLNQKHLPPFYDASWLVSISSRSLLKPAYADNKIRAWGDSLATWPKKRWLFVCAALDQGKESGAGSGCEVKGQQTPFSHRTGVTITSQRGPALITSAEITTLTFILVKTLQEARGPQHAQLMPWNGRGFFFFVETLLLCLHP